MSLANMCTIISTILLKKDIQIKTEKQLNLVNIPLLLTL